MRILLVEDDEALCAAVAPLLEQEGYRVDVCRDGDDALYYMRQRMFGLCILDRMLPGRDGLSVLRAARAEGLDTPVLICCEPTRGIDVGAKSEIYKLMTQLAEEGKSIIMISSDMPELLRLSDRVIVMCEGHVTGELDISEATQETIMTYATKREVG